LLGLAAQAEDSLSARGGQFLTVRVLGAPRDVSAAQLDLNGGVRGLALRREGNGVWTGGFVLLPNMVLGTIRPEVRLFRGQGREPVSRAASGATVEMASSELDGAGLALALSDRRATFVFGATIETASINFRTDAGLALPELSAQTFTLPSKIAPGQVSAIVAQTREGVDLIFSPHWSLDGLNPGQNF
jgi:hypothetical protein